MLAAYDTYVAVAEASTWAPLTTDARLARRHGVRARLVAS
jgi:predicted nucleic acid-binding protein